MRYLNFKKKLKKKKFFLLLYISILVFSFLGSINTFYKFTNIESISSDNYTKNDLNTAEIFNYIMMIDYEYNWIDASGGTELLLRDDGFTAITLPFNFQFYDENFTTIYLSANGFLSFTDPLPNDFTNDPIPSGDPDNYYLIAPFWDDLQPAYGGGGGNIYVQSFGTYWVAEWLNIYHWSGGPLVGSFEIILYESGEIIFNYDYLSYTGGGYTCGLNLGVDIQYYNSYQGLNDLTDNFTILFTYEPPSHDLSVSLEYPLYCEIDNTYTINATVTNTGINDETDVNLFLYLDDVIVNSTTISSLLVGASETINYMWTPTEYKAYNFTAYAPPVPDESYIGNNIKTKLIPIMDTKLFDGMYIDHIFTAPGGSGPSRFSYSYYSGNLFFETWSVDSATWYVDSQTRLMSGGSIFGDGTHTPAWIFTNVTLDDKILIAVDGEGDHLFNVSSELIYDLPGFDLVEVWVLEDLTTPGGVAWYEKSTGILLNGTFYFSGGLDWYAFDFVDTNVEFTYFTFNHELKVSLEVPTYSDIDNTYTINATVFNNGEIDETDVDLFLYLDDVIVNSKTISSLLVNASETIDFIWTPTVYKTYNFTVYAPPVPDESYIGNNNKTKLISIQGTKLFDGMCIDHILTTPGGSFPLSVSYSYYSGTLFFETWKGLEFSLTWYVDSQTRLMSGGSIFGDGEHTPAWIFTNVTLDDKILIAVGDEGDHLFNVSSELIYDLPGFDLVEVWVLEDLDFPGGVAWYEKSTGILLNGTFYYGGGEFWHTFDFVDANVEFTYFTFNRELKVSLDVPSAPEINNPYVITATVINNGLNDETDVNLFLYFDDVIVNSTTIPSLLVGTSETIDFIWTPTEYRTYNFTAYAPPVLDESYIDNNIKTKLIPVIDIKLFDGMYIDHIFTAPGGSGPSRFSYSYYSGSLFNETWDFMGSSSPWYVDSQTRLMSGGSDFGDGTHTPAWIFTNVKLDDKILISVGGQGDHLFNVSNELIYDLPGFGSVDVWVLEDLNFPGGVAWYEKSTGILLNGTFHYLGESAWYTFDFVDTNVEFTYLDPPGDFILSSNAGTLDDDGNFDLTWESADRALNYSVYQYSSYITEINGSLTLLIDETTDLSLALSVNTNGIYYFIVVAHNNYGDTLSNCIEVAVGIPPGDFILSSNAGTLDDDGNFDITWESADRALTYSVYQYSSFITEINGSLTLLIEGTTNLSLALSDYTDGTYYFIAIAHNAYGDTLSNCIEVVVQISPPEPEPTPPVIPGYNLYVVISMICIVSIILFKKRYQLNKN